MLQSEKKAILRNDEPVAVIKPVNGSANDAVDRTEDQGGPLVIRMPVDIRSISLTVIAVLAAIVALQLAQSVLIPVVLAVLISYSLAPLVGSLARAHVPRAIGAAVAICLLVGSIGFGAYSLSDETMSIVANVPVAARRLRERVLAHRRAGGGAL